MYSFSSWLGSGYWNDQGFSAVTTAGRMDYQAWVVKQKVWASYYVFVLLSLSQYLDREKRCFLSSPTPMLIDSSKLQDFLSPQCIVYTRQRKRRKLSSNSEVSSHSIFFLQAFRVLLLLQIIFRVFSCIYREKKQGNVSLFLSNLVLELELSNLFYPADRIHLLDNVHI